MRHPGALRLVRARVGRAPRAYAWLVVWLRLPVLALWIAAATLAFVHLPSFGSSEGPVIQLIPPHAAALRTSATLLRIFKVPAGSEFAVVVRDPNGLSAEAHAAVAQQALDVDRGRGGASGPSFAVPIANDLRLLPGSRESGTTAITFLYYPPTMPVGAQMASAHHYVARLAHATGRPAALTGAIPGQFAQGVLIDHNLNLIELITLALIVLVIAVSYRSAAAPLVPLAAIGVAFPIALVGLHQLSTDVRHLRSAGARPDRDRAHARHHHRLLDLLPFGRPPAPARRRGSADVGARDHGGDHTDRAHERSDPELRPAGPGGIRAAVLQTPRPGARADGRGRPRGLPDAVARAAGGRRPLRVLAPRAQPTIRGLRWRRRGTRGRTGSPT